jgi:NAD(P)-dependent dehydrogenase (short-subunit alcohol dehydrogenase family)
LSQIDPGLDLEGRCAIVTGASRGIGLEIARSLIEAGANVLITARSQAGVEAAVEDLGSHAVGLVAHAADEDSAQSSVYEALKRFGRLDILVNNAATNPAFGALVDLDRARFAKTMEVNVWAPIMWTGLAWRAWMREQGGAIVNVASIGGLIAGPNTGAYRASKAALIHLTRQLALELAPGVRVNAVAPGLVRTKMAEALWKSDESGAGKGTLLGRIGEPHDVAGAVRFLLGESAGWITGETLVIDGGQMILANSSRHGDAAADRDGASETLKTA